MKKEGFNGTKKSMKNSKIKIFQHLPAKTPDNL
jgi:hypothetical protein